MTAPVLATKLIVPLLRRRLVARPRLIERLTDATATGHGLILVSAPAGFGKTTLVAEWAAGCGHRVAWLSLDEEDSDPARFLTYLIAAVQTVAPGVGEGQLAIQQSPQPVPPQATIAALLNEIAALPSPVVLVLDDYHLLEARTIDDAVAFLVEHLPTQLRLVIATREDPALPLARLRARGQLTELRAADLRFTPDEAAEFLTRVMNLDLSADEIGALDTRTEGWAAGLQLAAISLQGRPDAARFIESFAGSDRFVLDYLLEEVLRRQPDGVQTFLLRTSILERLCGPLCDAILRDASTRAQETLEYLDRANLFVVALDTERRWYRYHHLFRDLLRQRRQLVPTSPDTADADHLRASEWFEVNGFEVEAFSHAAAGHDVDRAERLIKGRGVPLHDRGALAPIISWLGSLPAAELDARPSLWITYASVLLGSGQTDGVEPRLQAAERALPAAEPDARVRDLIGRIASTRAMLALAQGQVADIVAQGRRALEYLDAANLPARTFTNATLGYAYRLTGDRAGARKAYAEARAIGQATGNTVSDIVASIGLGAMQEADNELHLGAETYRQVIATAAEMPYPVISEAYLGLARIHYQWNELEAAGRAAEQSAQLARQIESTDRPVACRVLLARLELARGHAAEAASMLAEAERIARQRDFALVLPEVGAAQIATRLYQGDVAGAARLARQHELPLSRARVLLAEGEPPAALTLLESHRCLMEERAWADLLLETIVLQALALHAEGRGTEAVDILEHAMAMAEPEGFVRLFLDEGLPMARLLSEALLREVRPAYARGLLAAFAAEEPRVRDSATRHRAGSRLAEPLSRREFEVLSLVAGGLSNEEIATRLYLSPHTVKAHARTIYEKLGVGSRTQAAAKARAIGLLSKDGAPDA